MNNLNSKTNTNTNKEILQSGHNNFREDYTYSTELGSENRKIICLEECGASIAKFYLNTEGKRELEREYRNGSLSVISDFLEYLNTKEKTKNTNKEIYNNELLPVELDFKHDKLATSRQHVLRGLHGDTKTWKLVSCAYGEIMEVVVDMRKDSPTYLKWEAFDLKAKEYTQVLIPPGFVNGYYVKTETAVFHYKLAYDGEYIDANEQITVAWNDKRLGIDWPCENPILQERDILEK